MYLVDDGDLSVLWSDPLLTCLYDLFDRLLRAVAWQSRLWIENWLEPGCHVLPAYSCIFVLIINLN